MGIKLSINVVSTFITYHSINDWCDTEIIVSQKATFDVPLVKEITLYIVSVDDDEFIFQNPEISSDTVTVNFKDVVFDPNNSNCTKMVVFTRGGNVNTSYSVVFVRPVQAKRFRDFRVTEHNIIIRITYFAPIPIDEIIPTFYPIWLCLSVFVRQLVRQNAEFVSGSITKSSPATATDVPRNRIICSHDENGDRHFRVSIGRDSASSFDFNFGEVNLMNYSRNMNTRLVEMRRRRLSKIYQFYFEDVNEQKAFMSLYHDRSHQRCNQSVTQWKSIKFRRLRFCWCLCEIIILLQ